MKIVADQNIPFVSECFSSIGDVTVVGGRDMSAKAVADADVLLVRSVTKVDEKLLANSNVKFVATATIGFEHLDTDYLTKNKIGFASAPGSNANSVAEYIVAALLEVGRKHSLELEGKSIGIIGAGNVGSKVENKCKALRMLPVLNDPPLQRASGDQKYRPISELFNCDIITLHTPLTFEGQDKTYHLADEKFFGAVKKGVVFINTARGGVVDTSAVKVAMKSGKIKAAVLDVWEDEPAIDTDLLEMVDIGTPHIAGYSYDGKIAGMIMIYKGACAYFNLEPKYEINDFLPKPQVPKIKLEPKGHSEQQVLRAVVEEIYKIRNDDAKLRIVLPLPLGKRCATFDKLRKDYPIRREFQNTKVLLTADAPDRLVQRLRGIGFDLES